MQLLKTQKDDLLQFFKCFLASNYTFVLRFHFDYQISLEGGLSCIF